MYLQILIAGFGGGIVRGLVGFIKHQYSYKNVSFNLPYFLAMSFISGVVGVLAAAVANELGIAGFSPALALVFGYAGGDFLENVYKIIIKKTSLYPLPEKSEKEK
jgi:ABC-type thiamin/hydroxymethylpyrimidine transport system permease subunit